MEEGGERSVEVGVGGESVGVRGGLEAGYAAVPGGAGFVHRQPGRGSE